MSEPTEPLTRLTELFDVQARGMQPGSASALRTAGGRVAEPPRVAVVDATPYGLSKADSSGHGYSVSRVVGTLACEKVDSPECAEMIRPYVALPLAKSGGKWVESANGGSLGYFHDLFRAFELALSEWDAGPAKNQHLIVNLSLGWDPAKTDGNSVKLERMTELLSRAYCEGALVIAAAGNRTGSEGPLLPAALESQTPPDARRCKQLGYPLVSSNAKYRPLIHAVGAVDQYDQRLVLARPLGQPRLAAYGMQVVVPAQTATGYTVPQTGTSMSAAVVSGIAAAVWSARPDLDAGGVMAAIYDGGRELDWASGNRAEFCMGNDRRVCEGWAIRRASLCGALNEAVPDAKHACAQTPEFAPLQVLAAMPTPAPISPCRVEGCGLPSAPMDVQRFPGAVLPMPGVASCPGCALTLGTLLGRTVGTVHGTASLVPSGLTATIVRTYVGSSPSQDFNLTPMPVQNVGFSQAMFMNRPTAAEIRWTYCNGICVVAVTPLIMN